MKNIVFILILIITAFFLQTIGPWWIAAVPALILGYYYDTFSPLKSFALGFLGIFLLWSLLSGITDINNQGILSGRIGAFFGGMNSISLIAITGLIGGILGGLSTATGRFLNKALA